MPIEPLTPPEVNDEAERFALGSDLRNEFVPQDLEEFDRLSEPAVPVIFTESLMRRGKRVASIVPNFLVGQGAAQGVAGLAGLFLVR